MPEPVGKCFNSLGLVAVNSDLLLISGVAVYLKPYSSAIVPGVHTKHIIHDTLYDDD